MALFSSRAPDTDPYPWEHPNSGRIPRRYGRVPFDSYRPRAAFTYPQTNPTNPILDQFRKSESVGNVYAIRQWVNFLTSWDHTIVAATPEQITHARRVLSLALRMHEAS